MMKMNPLKWFNDEHNIFTSSMLLIFGAFLLDSLIKIDPFGIV